MREYDPSILQTNGVTDVNGYQFVYISQDSTKAHDEGSTGYLHNNASKAAFKNNMEAAAKKSEGKPMFVIMHPNVTDTVFGSYYVTGLRTGKEAKSTRWGTTELLDTLKAHPNAITFSGHSHWSLANPRSVHRHESGFYSLNTGAVNNLEIEENAYDEAHQPRRYGTNNENESSGYYLEIKTDETVDVHKLDFNRPTADGLPGEFGEPHVIDVNAADNGGRDYTDARDHENPKFAADAAVTISDVTETDCKVTFPQATDDIEVASYLIEYVNQATGKTDKVLNTSSYYWLNDTADAIKNHYVTMAEFRSIWNNNSKGVDTSYYTLADNTTYQVKVTAVDVYGKKSEPITSEVFTTHAKELMPLDQAVISSAFFTNNRLMDNSPYAVENDMTVGVSGTTPIQYSTDLKRYEATADKEHSCYNIPLPTARWNLLTSTDGYTMETYFKITDITKKGVILGAAQSGGFDLEYNTDGKLLVYVRNSSTWISSSNYPGSNTTLKQDQYYHLAVTVTPSSVKVYLDGKEIDSRDTGSVFVPPTGTNMRDHYSMHLGGNYNNGATVSQDQMTGKIVFGKLYQRALTADEVKVQYDNVEKRKSLTKVESLKTMLTETLAGMTTTPELKALLQEGWLLMGETALTDEAIDAYLEKAAAYKPVEPIPDGKKLHFAVLSDYQYGRGLPSGYQLPEGCSSYDEAISYKVKNAIRQVIEKSKDANGCIHLDAIMVPGDMTHNGRVKEYERLVADLDSFPEIWSTTNPTGTIKMVFLRGNHENNEDTAHDQTSNYYKYLSKYGVTGDTQVYDVKGYQFIMTGQTTKGYSDFHNPAGVDYLHSEETIQWLNTQLKTVAAAQKAAGKPVFVGTHPNPYDTVYGSFKITNPINGAEGSVWSTKDFYGMERKNATQEEKDSNFRGMKDYQNIISFSGHSHWTIQNPRSIWQGEFTALNTGSVNNMELENAGINDGYMPKRYGTHGENESTGYYVTVDENEIVDIEVLDLYRNSIYTNYQIDVNDKANWKYTDEKRKGGKSAFAADAKISFTGLTESDVTVNYPQASDSKTEINYYAIRIKEKASGQEAVTPVVASSYYWLKGTKDEITTNNWSFSGLKADTEYVAEITPYNVYYEAGEPLTAEFTTVKDSTYVPKDNLNVLYDLNLNTVKKDDSGVIDLNGHGISLDPSKNVIWTPKVEASTFTSGQEAIRLSTKGLSANPKGQPGRMMRLDFAKDTVLKPATFQNGVYELETVVGLVHDGEGTINLKLYGDKTDGGEAVISTLNVNGPEAAADPKKAYMLDAQGNAVGRKVDASIAKKSADQYIDQYMRLRFAVDLQNHTYSAYLAPQEDATSYKLLVQDQPFDENISSLKAIELNITGEIYTYGAAVKQICVMQEPAAFTAVVTADRDALTAGTPTGISAAFRNTTAEAHTAALYAAAYDAQGRLIEVQKAAECTVPAGQEKTAVIDNFKMPANAQTVKVFTWENHMKPLDMVEAVK